MPARAIKTIDRRRGFVMVTVLWVLAILTVVTLGFARRAAMERRMAWYALDREQAQQMARGAAERAIFEVHNKLAVDAFLDQSGYVAYDQRWARPVNIFTETNYYVEPSQGEFERDECVYRIRDAESRISINHAPREVLDEVEGLDMGAVRAIMARREEAEGEERTVRFLSIDELRSLEDISDRAWYGTEPGTGLRDILTVWGTGNGMININTASEPVLRAIPGLNDSVCEVIVTYRNGPDGVLGTADDHAFTSIDTISEVTEIGPEELEEVKKYCMTQSSHYTIEAYATRREGKIRASCRVTVTWGNAFVDDAGIEILEWREDTFGT